MAKRVNRKTWTVSGTDAALHISEVSGNDPAQEVLTYEEAKKQALAKLREQLAPYLERISELLADHDLEAGALPTSKAWVASGIQSPARMLIIAPTKAKAIELSGESRYSFNWRYSLASGDWWYHLAHDGDGIWIKEREEKDKGTGLFRRPLDRHESNRILENALAPYRDMSIDGLAAMGNQVKRSTGLSSVGTPYKLTVSVTTSCRAPNMLRVDAEIDDCLGWWPSTANSSIKRTIPSSVADWKREGF